MNNLNKFWKSFAAGATVLSYVAWAESRSSALRAEEIENEYNNKVNILQSKIDTFNDQISSTIGSEVKNILSAKILEIKNQVGEFKAVQSKYFCRLDSSQISQESNETFSRYEQYKSAYVEAMKILEKGIQDVSDVFNNMDKNEFIGGNVSDLMNNFIDYLGTLSTMEICLVINITSSLFIISCIISIIFAILGNSLLEKLVLEKRFPKLGRIIQLRVKFQRYYIIMNSCLIFLAVLGLLYVNIVTLLGW